MKIAAILTCFNRKEKTRSCLKCLFEAAEYARTEVELSVYLTDDNSTDGTGDMVRDVFPSVKVLSGTGSLYWAGGMRFAWKEALKGNYDYYLLLNDDTVVFKELFTKFFEMRRKCNEHYGKDGVISGVTCDSTSKKTTYGGDVFINKFFATTKRLNPNGSLQECDLTNANILFIPQKVVNKIGIFDSHYIHGGADYDYALCVRKAGFPLLISPEYLGFCKNDHRDVYENFVKSSFEDRKKMIRHPTALGFDADLYFAKKHFYYRYPIVFFAGKFKLSFPRLYLTISNIRKKLFGKEASIRGENRAIE